MPQAIPPAKTVFVKFFDLDLDTYRLPYEAMPVPQYKSHLNKAIPTLYGIPAYIRNRLIILSSSQILVLEIQDWLKNSLQQ